MNIGFVGVGRMGANMARRLKDRGFHVTTVFDVNPAAATSLAQELGCRTRPWHVSAGADYSYDRATTRRFWKLPAATSCLRTEIIRHCSGLAGNHVEVERLRSRRGVVLSLHCFNITPAHGVRFI